MRKVQLRFVLVLLPLFLLLGGCAQKPKMYHVSILSGLDFFAPTTDGFKAKMAKLGYAEGKNIEYDLQSTNFNPVAEARILQKFILDKPDLILTFPTEVSLAAKSALRGTKIPLIFANAFTDGVDLVDSIRASGSNLTGVRLLGPDLALKRLDVMLELAPAAKRVLVPYQRGYPIVRAQLETLRPAAASVGVTIEEMPASDPGEVAALLEKRELASVIGIDAILMIAEPLGVTPDAFVVLSRFAKKHGLPIGGAMIVVGECESFFGVMSDSADVGIQAAVLADKILQGIPAGAIPIVSAENHVTINYRALKNFGTEPSEGLLSRADEIIR